MSDTLVPRTQMSRCLECDAHLLHDDAPVMFVIEPGPTGRLGFRHVECPPARGQKATTAPADARPAGEGT